MTKETYAKLAHNLGYQFKNTALLETALMHRSVSSMANNERLEFLGDSIVNFIIAEALYEACPEASEGRLTRLRANLVNGEELAVIARDLEVGNFLSLSPGEIKSRGRERTSTLADTLEAIIAAIYLDAGLKRARECVLNWFSPRLTEKALDKSGKDPKTALQEYLQAKKCGLPIYETLSTTGHAHQQQFRVSCSVQNLSHKTIGVGSNRRRAEQMAAEKCLSLLLETTHDNW